MFEDLGFQPFSQEDLQRKILEEYELSIQPIGWKTFLSFGVS